MFMPRIRTAFLAVGAALSLGACGYYDGYGGGVSVGYSGGYYDDYYDPYYGGGGYYDPYYGGSYGRNYGSWYNNFYYPGYGVYVFDRGGRRYSWNDDQRRYFEGRGYRLRDREDRRDFRQFRREGRQDAREYRQESRDAIQRFRRGEITRDQLQTELRGERREYRQDRREYRRDWREDRRDWRDDGRDWRNDRFAWRDYRRSNDRLFRQGRYIGPERGWRYRPVGVGHRFDPAFYGSRYVIADPYRYRLPPVRGFNRWVRYGNDVVLVDARSGRVLEVYNSFFY